jgi:hypothetical protein
MASTDDTVAVLIGFNYARSGRPLRGCINDVVAVYDFLLATGQCGAPDVTVVVDDGDAFDSERRRHGLAEPATLVVDGDMETVDATVAAAAVRARAGGALVVVYFAGHGLRVMTNDDPDDGCACWLCTSLRGHRRVVVVADCCGVDARHALPVARCRCARRRRRSRGGGRLFLTVCSAKGYEDVDGERHCGLLTTALLAALRRMDDGRLVPRDVVRVQADVDISLRGYDRERRLHSVVFQSSDGDDAHGR